MEIDPLNRVGMGAPVNLTANSQGPNQIDSQVVAAVQGLNQSELMGQDRSLMYRRDPKSGRLVIQIVERESGSVVDQIPPEVVLRLYAEFGGAGKVKEPQK